MVPDINPWAVALATISTMAVGSLWYTPKVLGTLWMRLAGITPERMRTRSPVVPILVTLVVSLVTALVLAGCVDIAHAFYGGSWFANSLITGLFLFVGFTAARMITHDAFEGRPATLTILNITHELVTVLVMALIIGLLPA